jgi:hypothetical protein
MVLLGRHSAGPGPRAGRSVPVRPLIVVPLLAAAILIAGAAAGGWVLWPLWWLLPIMLVRFGWRHRGWRRRQWH